MVGKIPAPEDAGYKNQDQDWACQQTQACPRNRSVFHQESAEKESRMHHCHIRITAEYLRCRTGASRLRLMGGVTPLMSKSSEPQMTEVVGTGGTNLIFRPYERLVQIKVLGKTFEVPEKNTILRCFQYI